jgi:dTDP-4-dehydrorhamnose reductase
MTTKRPIFLVTGAGGQVGHALLKVLPELGDVVATDVGNAPNVRQVDFTDASALVDLVRAVKPSVIINPAAYTAVDKAEAEAELAHKINAVAPGVLAAEAKRLGVPLIHYSTDYVFDGSGSAPRREDASTGPLSVYGRSKLDGELAITASGANHVILRTSWVFSEHGHNFVKTMLKLGAEREELKIVADQIGAPTSAAFLADMTVTVIKQGMAAGFSAKSGTYHLACAGETSWHGFASEVFRQGRERGATLKVQRIEPIPTEAYPTPARRPKNSRLDCTKFERAFAVGRPTWHQALSRVMADLMPGAPNL